MMGTSNRGKVSRGAGAGAGAGVSRAFRMLGGLRVLGAVAIACGLMAGCSTQGDLSPSGEATSSADGVATAPKLAEEAIVTRDVTQTSCESGPGSVSATGSVKNSAKDARDIVVVVTWTSADGATVLATTPVSLGRVAPGESLDYKAQNTVKGADSSLCTVQARSGMSE